jgi:hypothetical protein
VTPEQVAIVSDVVKRMRALVARCRTYCDDPHATRALGATVAVLEDELTALTVSVQVAAIASRDRTADAPFAQMVRRRIRERLHTQQENGKALVEMRRAAEDRAQAHG